VPINANLCRFILGLGVAIGFAAAVPKLGATGGYIRAEYSVKLPAIIIIFIISGLGLKTKALLTALGDLRIHFLIQVMSRTGGQAGRRVDRQADRRAGRYAGRWAGRWAGRQAGSQAGRQAGRQADTQAGRIYLFAPIIGD